MRTLVSADVHRERQAERGRRSGAARRESTRERDARIVHLRVVEGLSYAEIASVLSLPRSTVVNALKRLSGGVPRTCIGGRSPLPAGT